VEKYLRGPLLWAEGYRAEPELVALALGGYGVRERPLVAHEYWMRKGAIGEAG